jgi:DnaJ-class molecular chaperone
MSRYFHRKLRIYTPKEVLIDANVKCIVCNGSGTNPDSTKCQVCKGTGWIEERISISQIKFP